MKSIFTSSLSVKEKSRPEAGQLGWLEEALESLQASWINFRDRLCGNPVCAWVSARFRAASLVALHLASLAGWWFGGRTERIRAKYPALGSYEAKIRRRALLGVASAARAYSTMTWARVALLTVTLVAAIGTVDLMLGSLVSFRLIYVLPIWLAARLGGGTAGFFSMLLVGTLLTFTDSQIGPGETDAIALNFALRWIGLGAFLITVLHVEGALQHARQLATHDPLTGLANRQTIQEMAQSAIAKCRGRANCLHVAIADCDQFKLLNDRNGHAFGDHALKVLARRLMTSTREIGAVGRLGGDEFVVLFLDVERGQAEAAMEKVNLAFRRVMASLETSTSISFGIATLGADGDDFESLCRTADERMFTRKRTRQAAVWVNEHAVDRRAC